MPEGGDSTLARPGGDEFAVLAEELHDPSDAVRVAERIQEKLSAPFELGGQQIVITASIGIAFGNERSSGAEEMLRDAEIAMYRAKHTGKARCEVFDNAMHKSALRRLELETDMRRALEAGEFHVYYQPVVSLHTGLIVGFEALSRWNRPAGTVMPNDFIPVANETGMILNINRELMMLACTQLCRWQRHFPADPPLSLSVNVSPKQFAQPDLAATIREVIQTTGVNPACLDLEITETIAMADADRSAAVLEQLRALGVRLDIDDFGTGYSSLSRLQRFPVDKLKIDRAFVSRMDSEKDTHEIVRIIVALAQNLGLKVVAEGIETHAQLELLRQIGVELGQGYLFSKPEDRETIEKLIRFNRSAQGGPLKANAAHA